MISIHDKTDLNNTGLGSTRVFFARPQSKVKIGVMKQNYPDSIFEHPRSMSAYRGYHPVNKFVQLPVYSDMPETQAEKDLKESTKAMPLNIKKSMEVLNLTLTEVTKGRKKSKVQRAALNLKLEQQLDILVDAIRNSDLNLSELADALADRDINRVKKLEETQKLTDRLGNEIFVKLNEIVEAINRSKN